MSCRGLRLSRSVTLIIFSALLVFLLDGILNISFAGRAFGQESETKPTLRSGNRNSSYFRDQLASKWNQRGRTAPQGQSPAALRLRAYQQKMAMRSARVHGQHPPSPANNAEKMSGARIAPASPNGSSPNTTSAIWMPLGPAPLASDATGDGEQNYNWVTGRATSVLIDPADSTGNTVLLGGAYGGLWRSTNAGSQSQSPASVIWQPLIDDQPTLAVGAIALQPGNSNVILVGTGETNNSPRFLLRPGNSAFRGRRRHLDESADPERRHRPIFSSFLGVGFSKIAFSTANPNLVVAATAGDNGLLCWSAKKTEIPPHADFIFRQTAELHGTASSFPTAQFPLQPRRSSTTLAPGTTGTFYAFIRRHGLYSSTDGQHFTRLATQPTPGLASANCPSTTNATGCQIYRGEFAVVPGRNEMYVWVVDLQSDQYGNPIPVDEGIWQSTNGGASWTQIPDNGITNCGDDCVARQRLRSRARLVQPRSRRPFPTAVERIFMPARSTFISAR